MAVKRPGLAQRRRAVGLSQEQLAANLGVDRSTIVRWERAGTAPQPGFRPKIARQLQISLSELDELLSFVEVADSDTDDRLAYVLRHPGSADAATVAQLRSTVQSLGEAYDLMPSGLLLAAAGQCHGQVVHLRLRARSDWVRQELGRLEAECAVLLGQLVWDASHRRDHATSLVYLDRAITAARQAHHPVAEGQALLRKAYVALYGTGEPRAGLDLAAASATASQDVSEVLPGLAELHVGEAHAIRGERRSCERVLASAEGHLDRIQPTDPAMRLFSPTHVGRLAGSCYLFLDQPARAASVLERTATLLQDRRKSPAIVLGNLSLAYIPITQSQGPAAPTGGRGANSFASPLPIGRLTRHRRGRCAP